jgi:hypothetical protein
VRIHSTNYVIKGEKKGSQPPETRVLAPLEDGGRRHLTQPGLLAPAKMCTNSLLSSLLKEFPTGFCRDAFLLIATYANVAKLAHI